MNPDTWASIGTIIIVNFGLVTWLRSDIAKLEGRMNTLQSDLGERIARSEGKVDLLLQGLQIRIEPKNTGGAD